ncbi:uncharacterized protein LOC110049208 [Paramuricea clavata]|uniref:Uncharacterized protein LOC110049208 n=1 Tax=Paramuricea clavata TaxID=317549 RepID=A0A7D9EHA5_PARCT|nr:uncharacterized protein LOC110049208 [Paramuricea clavata]
MEAAKKLSSETKETSSQRSGHSASGYSVVNECLMGAVAASNDKLIASFAKISYPTCYPNIFFGDATMFHPWKSFSKSMISDSETTAEQEMNYFHMYTRETPQKLVNSFRKRQYGDSNTLLKELRLQICPENGKRNRNNVLKGKTKTEDQEDVTKHCAFNDRQGHNLPECRAFKRKTLQEKTDWLRHAGRCFRCLQSKHLAKECKANIKCNKCGSKRHLDMLHMEKLKKKDNTEEDITPARTNVKCKPISRVSCNKIVLLEVYQQDEPDRFIKVYALIDEQSNSSMISRKLADKLRIVGPKEKYFLSTCCGSKETRYGRRVPGLVVK